jgi:phage gp36-like protein
VRSKLTHWKNVSRVKKFKIKRTKFCLDLLYHVRALSWRFESHPVARLFYVDAENDLENELAAFRKAQQILKDYLANSFLHKMEENEAILKNPKTRYHEYFAAVYRIERQRILINQIHLYDIAIAILTRIKTHP